MHLVPRLTLLGALIAGPLANLPLHAAPAKVAAKKDKAPEAGLLGAKAPAFRCSRWVKGTPVQKFEKGQVYVVEFWATWCGPCKMAIPHLTELAKEYQGKVTFIGVNILEKGQDPKKVDEKVDGFVAEMGAKMDYNVCRDTADGFMAKTWYKPAKFGGIPATLVVDGTGRIAWTGHPMNLDVALPAILAGRFDATHFNTALKADEEALKAIVQAFEVKDWTAALGLAQKYQPMENAKENYKDLFVLRALVHLDAQRAESLYESLKQAPASTLANIGYTLAQEEGLAKAWYERAASHLEVACQNEKDGMGYLAKAYFKAGRIDKAAEVQSAYIDWIKAEMAKNPEKKGSYEYMLREAKANMVDYRK